MGLLAFLAQPVAAQALRALTIASGLDHPWAVAFLPNGRFLVTERPGRMRVIEADGKVGAPLDGVPEVASGGQGGLLDLVLDSRFASNRMLYFCFAEPAIGGNSTALAKAWLSADASRLEDVKVSPSIAPSGMSFLTSDRYGPAMKGNLFVGSLKFGYLVRLELSRGQVVRESKALQVGERVRDVRQGPDGLLYLLTDESRGRLVRVEPAS